MNLEDSQCWVVVKRARAGLVRFARCPLKQGAYLLEYEGELLTHAAANRRGGKYLFYVNHQYLLDGAARTNLARYLNHACQPNAEAIVKGRRIYFRAVRKIAAGEEVTIHYVPEYYAQVIKPKGCRCPQHATEPKHKVG